MFSFYDQYFECANRSIFYALPGRPGNVSFNNIEAAVKYEDTLATRKGGQ